MTDSLVTLVTASANDLAEIPDSSVNLVATSPPYYGSQRLYEGDQEVDWPAVTFPNPFGGGDVTVPAMTAELGREDHVNAYVGHMILCLREWRRVLSDDGFVFLNLGDKYARKDIIGFKAKDLMMVPARVAMAAQADGWWLRNEVPWFQENGMPDSPVDRLTVGHEDVFILAKNKHYFFDYVAIRRPPAGYWRRGGSANYTAGGSASHGQGSRTLHAMAIDGRRARTSDIWLDSLKSLAAWHDYMEAHNKLMSAYLRRIARDGGAVVTDDLDGLLVNSVGYPGAHFASWPERLVKFFILAGTSEHGRCHLCRRQYVRVLEKEFLSQEDVSPERGMRGATGQKQREGRFYSGNPRGRTRTKTVGWAPTCDCDAADPEKAVVLDPFAGSGTTGRVAARLGRRAILADIHGGYLENLAADRVEVQMEMRL